MFYDIYCDLCKRKGVTPTRAAIEMGLSKSTPTAWKKQGITPQAAQLQKIANYFEVPIDYLMRPDYVPTKIIWDASRAVASEKEKTSQPDELEGVYLSFARQAQESRIDPKDIMLAIETIKKLRGD